MEKQLAAILYADVAGYSRLTGLDEEKTHRHLDASLSSMYRLQSTVTISSITNGYLGQCIKIKSDDSSTNTISHSSSLRLSGSVNFAMADNAMLQICMDNQGEWQEMSRKTP